MGYISFDKTQLINLEYSLSREIIRSNRAGSYCSTTIVGCNTRKYHGLLVCPLKQFENEKYILLSSLDETVIQNNAEFNLALHKYEGDNYNPKGHKYIRDFDMDIVPRTIYRVGGVVLQKESLLVEKEEQILIKYTLLEAHSKTLLRFKPFLAFRHTHALTRANLDANTRVKFVENGVKCKLYHGFPYLYMQFSKTAEFIPFPDWYYNIEYSKELERGNPYQEDLFVPGYFELEIKKGESIIFSASTTEAAPGGIKRKFEADYKKRIPRNSYRNCLLNSAEQFLSRSESFNGVVAGFPWFGCYSRDTFISLPGLTLTRDDAKTFRLIMDSMVSKLRGGLFPEIVSDSVHSPLSLDASLWFYRALQRYIAETSEEEDVWKAYHIALKKIIRYIASNEHEHIRLHDNGLLYAGTKGLAMTWMNTIQDGKPVTPRTGYAVEVNALWYNAVCFTLEMAQKYGDTKFLKEWKLQPETIRQSFVETFWNEDKKYLADYVDGNYKDWSVRPNQVIVTSLPYPLLSEEQAIRVLDVVKNELLTPRGLRSLSPKSPAYKGVYEGPQADRNLAYHQGSVWPWLIQPFADSYLKVYKKHGVNFIEKIITGFEDEMSNHGIGAISELYDGNPPHKGRGTISQAWSVGALLWAWHQLEKYKLK